MNSNQPLENKTKIFVKSEALFRRYGIKSVTMDDIARELGMSKKTLYQFVDNKSDLIMQIMKLHLIQEQEAILQIQKEATDAIDEMLKIAKYVLKQLRDFSPTIIYDLQKYHKDIWHLLENHHQHFVYAIIKENIEKGINEGLYRDNLHADIIAKLYVGKTMLVADEEMFPLQQYNKENLFKEYIEYHIHGIASKKGLKLLEKHTKS